MLVMLGTIKDKEDIRGYVFYDLNKDVVNKLYSVYLEHLEGMFKTKQVLGVRRDKTGYLVSDECSITRFATFNMDLRSNDIHSKIYILGYKRDNNGNKVFKVIYKYSIREMQEIELIKLKDTGYMLVNGKVISRGNNRYISAIRGNFAYMDICSKETGLSKDIIEDITKKDVIMGKDNIKDNLKSKGISVVKESTVEDLSSLGYTIMVSERWLRRLVRFEDLGRMFINWDLFEHYLGDTRVFNSLGELGYSIISLRNTYKGIARLELMEFLRDYRAILVGILKGIDLGNYSKGINTLCGLVDSSARARELLLKELGKEIRTTSIINTLNTTLTKERNKHIGVYGNYGYLYYLTAIGSLNNNDEDMVKFYRLYSFGKSLNETNSPVGYNGATTLGYTLSQAALLAYGDRLGIVSA